MSPPDLPDAWQMELEDPFPAAAFLAATAVVCGAVALVGLIVLPASLLERLRR